jgi:DNA topoisomerase III
LSICAIAAPSGALFTAQDPKSLPQAFDKLKPNRELRPLYEAAVARQQLTRTATRTLLTRGVKGVIGIGRVKTPTLAIVCLREIAPVCFVGGVMS